MAFFKEKSLSTDQTVLANETRKKRLSVTDHTIEISRPIDTAEPIERNHPRLLNELSQNPVSTRKSTSDANKQANKIERSTFLDNEELLDYAASNFRSQLYRNFSDEEAQHLSVLGPESVYYMENDSTAGWHLSFRGLCNQAAVLSKNHDAIILSFVARPEKEFSIIVSSGFKKLCNAELVGAIIQFQEKLRDIASGQEDPVHAENKQHDDHNFATYDGLAPTHVNQPMANNGERPSALGPEKTLCPTAPLEVNISHHIIKKSDHGSVIEERVEEYKSGDPLFPRQHDRKEAEQKDSSVKMLHRKESHTDGIAATRKLIDSGLRDSQSMVSVIPKLLDEEDTLKPSLPTTGNEIHHVDDGRCKPGHLKETTTAPDSKEALPGADASICSIREALGSTPLPTHKQQEVAMLSLQILNKTSMLFGHENDQLPSDARDAIHKRSRDSTGIAEPPTNEFGVNKMTALCELVKVCLDMNDPEGGIVSPTPTEIIHERHYHAEDLDLGGGLFQQDLNVKESATPVNLKAMRAKCEPIFHAAQDESSFSYVEMNNTLYTADNFINKSLLPELEDTCSPLFPLRDLRLDLNSRYSAESPAHMALTLFTSKSPSQSLKYVVGQYWMSVKEVAFMFAMFDKKLFGYPPNFCGEFMRFLLGADPKFATFLSLVVLLEMGRSDGELGETYKYPEMAIKRETLMNGLRFPPTLIHFVRLNGLSIHCVLALRSLFTYEIRKDVNFQALLLQEGFDISKDFARFLIARCSAELLETWV